MNPRPVIQCRFCGPGRNTARAITNVGHVGKLKCRTCGKEVDGWQGLRGHFKIHSKDSLKARIERLETAIFGKASTRTATATAPDGGKDDDF